jgi:hypothetical protein
MLTLDAVNKCEWIVRSLGAKYSVVVTTSIRCRNRSFVLAIRTKSLPQICS